MNQKNIKTFIFIAILSLFCKVIDTYGFEKNELVFLTWDEYVDPDLIKKFEKKFNAIVKFVYFENDEKRNELLSFTKGTGYDVILVADGRLATYIKRGWITPINTSNVPNLKYIESRFIPLDSNGKIKAVPYLWGTTGIAYRRDLLKMDIYSWKQLYNPTEILRKKIIMISDSTDTINLALKCLGYSLNTEDIKELDEVDKLLLSQKPFVRSYSYTTLSKESPLVTGEIWMLMMYNGDALSLQKHNPEIKFLVPSEGTQLWVDCLALNSSSTKKELALSFINFFHEPENAAKSALYLNYATPNLEAKKLLPSEHLNNTNIYPSEEIISKSEFVKQLSPLAQKKRNNIFFKLLH